MFVCLSPFSNSFKKIGELVFQSTALNDGTYSDGSLLSKEFHKEDS